MLLRLILSLFLLFSFGACADDAEKTADDTANADKCATDNGGCGDSTFYTCTNNEGADPTCADIDECATDNGGCGDSTYYECHNLVGAGAKCSPNDGDGNSTAGWWDPDFNCDQSNETDEEALCDQWWEEEAWGCEELIYGECTNTNPLAMCWCGPCDEDCVEMTPQQYCTIGCGCQDLDLPCGYRADCPDDPTDLDDLYPCHVDDPDREFCLENGIDCDGDGWPDIW